MRSKRTIVYETKDGKEFTNLQQAIDHEFRQDVYLLVEELRLGRGGEWSGDMIADAIIENKEKFKDLFLEGAREEASN